MSITFEVGAELDHPRHGPCKITFVGDDYIGIQLANGEQGLLKRERLISQLEAGATPERAANCPTPVAGLHLCARARGSITLPWFSLGTVL